jgi:type VI secretion system Hcp family effector
MTKYAFSLLLAPVALFAFSFSHPIAFHPTAFHSYVSFKGKKQGQLKAESTKAGSREKDGWFEIVSFEMGTEVPVDPKSGTPKGARQHSPIVITKEVDEASPLLLNAHYTNETFETIVIQTLDDQKNKVTKTTTLKNALISEIKKNGTLESISFNFEDIQVQQ